MVAAIVTTNIACYAVENWVEKNNMGDVYGLGLLMFETSIWVQTGVAKHYWGKQMPQYSYENRREEERPRNFQSGPGLFRYNFL